MFHADIHDVMNYLHPIYTAGQLGVGRDFHPLELTHGDYDTKNTGTLGDSEAEEETEEEKQEDRGLVGRDMAR